jgi:hypothetical protein
VPGHDRADTGQGPAMMPRSGDIVRLDRDASVQFASPIDLRVIRIHDWQTYVGWVWLDGYQLDRQGDAIERRSVFVQIAGLRLSPAAAPNRTARNIRPPIAKQRTGEVADQRFVSRPRVAQHG